jgi:hypothetical protein
MQLLRVTCRRQATAILITPHSSWTVPATQARPAVVEARSERFKLADAVVEEVEAVPAVVAVVAVGSLHALHPQPSPSRLRLIAVAGNKLRKRKRTAFRLDHLGVSRKVTGEPSAVRLGRMSGTNASNARSK